MDKRRSKAARPNGRDTARKGGGILTEIPLPNGTSATASDDLPADDFADLRDMDFSQYIADNDDNAGSMNSISSPSLGMMSKTPFKTPVPSEYADEAIELDSSPAGRPIKLRDHLPGLGSSVEPSFAVDDSQQTKVIAKAADVPKAPPNPPARFSYSLSVSPDNARDAPINTNGSQLPAIDSGSPGAEEAAPAKGKTWQVKKAELPKRSTRNRKINGKKRPEAKQDDAAAVGNATEAAPAREIPPAKKMESSKETAPLKEAKPSKRPLLARMLSVLSEPESLKWEDPLVGGRQSPVDGDGCPPAQSPRSPGGTPTAQEDTAMLPVDDDGSIYEPSIPASFAEPFEFEALERERVPDSPPAGPKAKGTQAFPTFRLDPDAIGPNPQNDSPPKSPMKGARKGSSLEKRARGPQKTTVSSKRRRVQNPVKKRVVQPRSRAKSVRYHKDVEDELETPVTGPHEPQPTVTTDAPHTNSKSRVSETGRPTNVTVSSESASSDEGRINEMANSEDMEENEKAVGSPNRRASPTETSELEVVFKSQSSRPHTMTAQAGSPRPRGQRMAAKSPEAGLKALITPKSLSKPSCAGAKKSAEKNAPRDAPSQAQPGPSAQQNPAFEVFRQHILGQLTSIEAKQQQDRSSQNDDPNNTQAIAEKRSPVNIVPQHMLGNVLHSLMEKTLEYIKVKETDLESIVQEYQLGVTAFVDRVEKLHQVENRGMIKALLKERQLFTESCENGARACEGFLAELERCSPSARRSEGLQKWLEQGREMQEWLQGAEPSKN